MPKSKRNPSQKPLETPSASLLLEAEELIDRLSLGWTPRVDVSETPDAVKVRAELPGVAVEEIQVMMQDGILRIRGLKREPAGVERVRCYLCMERRYGKFDRQIAIERVVDVQKARARLENGILTVEIPKRSDRRGQMFEIPIEKKGGGGE